MRIALLQLNPRMGDLDGNTEAILRFIEEAQKQGASLLATPPFALTGYLPKDLLRRDYFYDALQLKLKALRQASDMTLLIGHPAQYKGQFFNATTLIQKGKIAGQYRQMSLPYLEPMFTYFSPGKQVMVVNHEGFKVGIAIDQDICSERYVKKMAKHPVDCILSLQALPFYMNSYAVYSKSILHYAKHTKTAIACANLVGGQDEWVFEGGSFAVNSKGECMAQAPFYQESLLVMDVASQHVANVRQITLPDRLSHTYQALVMSLRDYVYKNHFPGVLIGLSGGIDSALTLAIAADALGANKVNTVMLPSYYTSTMSVESAQDMTDQLCVKHHTIDIWPIYQQVLAQLETVLGEQPKDVTEENIQARIRGMLLMALSNKTGCLVLATGNKSELAVGYCTLYGDTVGGFAVLKDVSKPLVYELAKWRNHRVQIIPPAIIARAPSAELRANQADQDSLPDYDVLDAIMTDYMENHLSIRAMIAKGFAEADVEQVIRLLVRNEYKRQQGAIGPCITRSGFGTHWRYPVTNAFIQ